jgi:hypothetical protein
MAVGWWGVAENLELSEQNLGLKVATCQLSNFKPVA